MYFDGGVASCSVVLSGQPVPCDPVQKSHQLDEDAMILLHDISCCWCWMKEKLKVTFSSEIVDQLTGLWEGGQLF